MSNLALITGAYGFIGRHVALLYAQKGWRVIGLGHGSWARDEWRHWGILEWHTTDVTFDSLVTYGKEPDAIVHCAGSGSVEFSVRHPYQDYCRTVATSLSVLEYARLYAPQARIIYPSSAAVYGNEMAGNLPIRESSELRPVSPYGVHKKIAEDLCRSYSEHFRIPVIVIRLFSAFGTGLRKQLLWDACIKSRAGDVNFFGTGSEIRDWLHIKDVSALLFMAVDWASEHCPIVNGGSGDGVTVREVLGELFTCFGRSDFPLFTGVERSGDPLAYIADNSIALSWGWKPNVLWQDGVREYAEWFLQGAL